MERGIILANDVGKEDREEKGYFLANDAYQVEEGVIFI